MRQRTLSVLAATLLLLAGGCKKASNSNDEILAAVKRHLSERGTLNLAAFDTQIKQVTYQGDRAQAEVVFRVKNGQGAMQLGYNLEKRNGAWTVVEAKPAGSNFMHPGLEQEQSGAAPGTDPALSEALKNFKPQGGATPGTLPPGHPPIGGAAQPEPKKKP